MSELCAWFPLFQKLPLVGQFGTESTEQHSHHTHRLTDRQSVRHEVVGVHLFRDVPRQNTCPFSRSCQTSPHSLWVLIKVGEQETTTAYFQSLHLPFTSRMRLSYGGHNVHELLCQPCFLFPKYSAHAC